MRVVIISTLVLNPFSHTTVFMSLTYCRVHPHPLPPFLDSPYSLRPY